ncbi:hypothetical protein BV898_07374 [Hypsibius exemplaris]|uniref:SH3 domain-containing protein n=1 Tax=Hypsibius exemplaris TaxID=2072580 RepID=A0A1W0WTL4_HYPEX|nr:hypothetical protein BV898_07374 [Hypsibius exemplaris]
MNPRKLMRDFTGCITRGVQRTGERVGKVHTTAIDDTVGRMMEDLDCTKNRTALVLRSIERVLKPFRDQSETVYIYDTQKGSKDEQRQNPLTELGKRLIGAGEAGVRFAQVEFDRQMEITRIVLVKVEHAKMDHLRALIRFVDLQLSHETESTAILKKHKGLIEKYLSDSLDFSTTSSDTARDAGDFGEKVILARSSVQYQAQRPQEITLKFDELVKVYENNPTNEDPDVWMFVETEHGKKGYIPMDILKPNVPAGETRPTTP